MNTIYRMISKNVLITMMLLCMVVLIGCQNNLPPVEEAEHTQGLIFELNEYGESYKVIGYEGTDTDIVIASTYNDLPVTSVDFWSASTSSCYITKDIKITSITLPDTIESLDRSLNSCGITLFISSFVIPPKVSDIAHIFSGYGGVDVIIPEDHLYLKEMIHDGEKIIVTKDEKTLVFLPRTQNENKVLQLPNTIVEIGPYAAQFSNYKEIVLPDSLRVIGKYAFAYTGLDVGIIEKSTIIVSNLHHQITHIGDYAFFFSWTNPNLELPRELVELGKCAFGFSKLESVIFHEKLQNYSSLFSDFFEPESPTAMNRITQLEFKGFLLTDIALDLFIFQFIYENFVGKDETITIILPDNVDQAEACRSAIEQSIQIANLRKSHYEDLPTFIFASSNDS